MRRENGGLRVITRIVIAFAAFMLVFALNNIEAKADSESFQVTIVEMDPYFYDVDGFHVTVQVNDYGKNDTYKYLWCGTYDNWEPYKDNAILPITSKWDGNPNHGGYYGSYTPTFTYYTGLGGKEMPNIIRFFCIVQNSAGEYVLSKEISMSECVNATVIEQPKITGVDDPKVGSKFDFKAEAADSEKYTFYKTEWYEVNSTTGEETKIFAEDVAANGEYCCRIYFKLNRGYAVADGTIGLVNDTASEVYYDTAKKVYYMKKYYKLDGTPKIVEQPKSIRANSDEKKYIKVDAVNAKSYAWQIYENGAYRDITLNDGLSAFLTRSMQIYSEKVINAKVRCKITGYNNQILYSDAIVCNICKTPEITSNVQYFGEGDNGVLIVENTDTENKPKEYVWYYKTDYMIDWEKCTENKEHFSVSGNYLSLISAPKDLLEANCQIKCELKYNDSLGDVESRIYKVYPHEYLMRVGEVAVYFKDGQLETGWLKYRGEYYYFGEDYFMVVGFKKIDDTTYYFEEDGKMAKGWKHIGDDTYYFAKSGAMVTGWKNIDDNWYYFDENGVLQTGWLEQDNKRYYLDENGIMLTGTHIIDGETYTFGKDGVLQKNAQKINQWEKINNQWRYFDANGKLVTGWKSIGNKWYYFESNGIMATGWKKLGTKWYYLETNGVMQTGWKKLGTKWYYLEANGAMATGWKKLGTKWYYLEANGVMATGWKQLGDKWYYLKADGTMAANEKVTINSKSYSFDAKGVWIKK